MPAMLEALQSLFAPAAMGRLTLVVNHVLSAEPVAVERLRPHAGRRIELQPQAWPSLLPALPRLAFLVTPAGLLEWDADGARPAADLTVRFDAGNPALLLASALSGETPSVDIDGDAQLATDVNWLMQNLRWDVEADLERVFPAAAAHQIYRLGSALARAVRTALQGAASLRRRA
jgi:ubiquinone biosynthesis protein UbiJ